MKLFRGSKVSPPPGRFVIVGLPRSGSTYLMTLLGSHPAVYCSGEQYNPYAIVGIGGDRDDSFEGVVRRRDADPVGFLDRFYAERAPSGVEWAGFKFMLGHNIAAFRALVDRPDIRIIYVWRENRLAQAASLIKAVRTRRWAQQKPDAHVARRIEATPRQISHRWHEFEMTDYLFQHWLAQAPHRSITLEYRELFAPQFGERLCDFLGIAPDPRMKSPLVKQGSNTIADRFEDPRAISNYFRTIGYAHWLEDEL